MLYSLDFKIDIQTYVLIKKKEIKIENTKKINKIKKKLKKILLLKLFFKTENKKIQRKVTFKQELKH